MSRASVQTSSFTATGAPLGRPRVTLLAAVAANGVIGRGNDLPWHLPDDLKRFKALTMGHPVVMGRKTFDSILARLGKPLPGRRNLVVSRSVAKGPEGAEFFGSLEAALAACGRGAENKPGEVFIIGGALIYALALPDADRLQLTEIHADIAGDVHFPAYDRAAFAETSRQAGPPAEWLYDYVVYDRTGPRAHP